MRARCIGRLAGPCSAFIWRLSSRFDVAQGDRDGCRAGACGGRHRVLQLPAVGLDEAVRLERPPGAALVLRQVADARPAPSDPGSA